MTEQKFNTKIQQFRLWPWQRLLWSLIIMLLLVPTLALSAPFSSGSTGADGVFAPTGDTVLTVPPNGMFNYTTVNIPAGVTVTFARNATNTPITILASGDVTINGTISVNGKDGVSVNSPALAVPIGGGGEGGPGGFAGGAGGLNSKFNGGTQLSYGQGLGPGGNGGNVVGSGCPGSFGGVANTPFSTCNSGALYGTVTLLPLIGGSGGSGGIASGTTSCTNDCNGGGGGGGGGAILIASSGAITINGSITAKGGNGGAGGSFPGSPGSGGGIRLIANTIGGTGSILVTGGAGGGANSGWSGGAGRIRLETNSLSFSGTLNPSGTISTPGLVNFFPVPTLSITSIGGVSVTASPRGSFDSPDITLPSSGTFTVSLSASNIPVGTVVNIYQTGRNGSTSGSYNSTPLSGTNASSTATSSIDFNSTMALVLRAETTFAVQTASNDLPTFVEGEKVEKIRVASAFSGPSEVFLITESGKEVRWR